MERHAESGDELFAKQERRREVPRDINDQQSGNIITAIFPHIRKTAKLEKWYCNGAMARTCSGGMWWNSGYARNLRDENATVRQPVDGVSRPAAGIETPESNDNSGPLRVGVLRPICLPARSLRQPQYNGNA